MFTLHPSHTLPDNFFVLTWKDIQHSANGDSTELETSCSHTSNILPKHSVCTDSWILEKVLIIAQLFFQTWKRYGKYRYLKSGITVKSLGVFSFQSYNECFVSDVGQILFSLAHSFAVHHEKRFILAFFKVSVDHDLFDNLESGKRSYCFGKKSGKSLELWI